VPIETIKCQECGSAEVTEFKPGTYVCGHCEAVFRHVDPSKVTVENTPAFCFCGNPVQVQCNLCHAGICLGCDQMSRPREDLIAIPTVGFGFQIKVDYRTPEVSAGDSTMFISRAHLLAAIDITGEEISHLCKDCLGNFVPEAVQKIATNEFCISPFCKHPGKADTGRHECRCCGHNMCIYCEGTANWMIGLPRIDVRSQCFTFNNKNKVVTLAGYFDESPVYLDGLCSNCTVEAKMRLVEFVGSHDSLEFRIEGAKGAGFTIRDEGPRRWRQVSAHNERMQALTKHYAEGLRSVVNNLIESSECRCVSGMQISDIKTVDPHLFGGIIPYGVIDNRDSVSAAAAPSVGMMK
jgi:hypothetical protein